MPHRLYGNAERERTVYVICHEEVTFALYFTKRISMIIYSYTENMT